MAIISTIASVSDKSFQFYGADFPNSGIDPSLPIPASFHLPNGLRPRGKDLINKPDFRNCKIVMIGEALGENEEIAHRPFVGSTGTDLRLFAKQAGFPHHPNGWFEGRPFLELPNVYLDNVFKIHPPNNNLRELAPGADVFWKDILRRQLSCGILHPNIIIAVGAEAFYALCGEEAGEYPRKFAKISSWRGSVIQTSFYCNDPNTGPRKIKVIPVFHPSFIQKNWKKRYLLISDLKHAISVESEYPELRSPKYTFITSPSIQDVKDYVDLVKTEEGKRIPAKSDPAPDSMIYPLQDPYSKSWLGFDYETHPPFPRTIAYSLDGKLSICIPYTHWDLSEYWENPEDELIIWQSIAEINSSKIPKIGQNAATYDIFYSYFYGVPITWFWFDTHYGHKALHPELPSKLETLTSIYTNPRQQYYKADGKANKKKNPGFTEKKFFEYNCLDTVVLHPISKVLINDLIEANLWRVYIDRYLELAPHLMQTSLDGVQWNLEYKNEILPVYNWLLAGLQEDIDSLVGHALNVASPLQMKKLLYEEWNVIKVYKGRGKDKKLTTNTNALLKTRRHFPKYIRPINTILALKKVRNRLSGTINARYDKFDEHIRSSITMNPETGRNSSMECPIGTGRNLQNFERGSEGSWEDHPYTNMRKFLRVDKEDWEIEKEELEGGGD